MIQFILKDKVTNVTNEVSLEEIDFFKKSKYLSSLEDKDSVEDFSYSITELESLVLILEPSNFFITYSNHPVRNILNVNYNLNEGKSIFDLFVSLDYVGMGDIFNNLEVGESKKFEYTIYKEDKLIQYYIFDIFRSSDSILFTSSQNIKSGVPLDKPKGLFLIIQNDSIVYANDDFLSRYSKTKEEIYNVDITDFKETYGDSFIEAYDAVKKGYSIFKEFNLVKIIDGIEHKFNIFLSSIIYENKPSIKVNVLDISNPNLINELVFKSQNDIQILRSFAKIATFSQNSHSDKILWSSEASSVLGMVPSSLSLRDDLFAYIVPEEKVNFEKSWINAIINKQDIITQFTIKTPSDELKQLSLFVKIIYSEKGEILNIKGIIQDISKLFDYKSRFEDAMLERESYLKRDHSILRFIFDYIYNLSMKENEEFGDAVYVLEKTQNRLFVVSLIYKLVFSTSKFSPVNLKNYFEKFLEGLMKWYGLFNINVNLDVENTKANFNQVLSLSFSINEIMVNLLKFASPQMSASVDVSINKNDSDLNLYLLVDLVLIEEKDLSVEFSDLKKLVKACNANNFQVSITDSGTQFDLSFS